MIEERNLLSLKSRFSQYVKGFYSDNMEFDENIKIKEEHTKRVRIEILDIAQSLNLDRNDFYLAEVSALLHDIGRFEQYARYGTFMDSKSEDHAALGVKIIIQNNFLIEIDQPTCELIQGLVRYHNKANLPKNKNVEFLFFLKLLRDADKIDIWRVVTEYYKRHDGKRNIGIELGLPDIPDFSGKILTDIMEGNIARIENVKTLNDFKLLQMSWIYDINFPRSFQIIKKRKYLEKIYNALPQADNISEAYLAVKSHLERNCKNDGCFYAVP